MATTSGTLMSERERDGSSYQSRKRNEGASKKKFPDVWGLVIFFFLLSLSLLFLSKKIFFEKMKV